MPLVVPSVHALTARLSALRPPEPSRWSCDRDDCDGLPHDWWDWRHARGSQHTPGGEWFAWVILAGRGFGKTRTGAEDIKAYVRENPGCRVALVAQTFTDGRDTMVEGESGLLNILEPTDLVDGSRDRSWNRSLGELKFANGSRAKIYSSEKPGQLRGPQHHRAWADEPAKFKDAARGDGLDTTWNNLVLGLRLGNRPQVVVTGTPTPALLIRQLTSRENATITRGSTYDNLSNLAPTFQDEVLARYEGTRIGRQELYGEILDDVEGALWTLVMIDDARVAEAPELVQIAVAIDPAGGTSEHNDETGIVVVGRSADRHLYVLEDLSGRYTPREWSSKAMSAYERHQADRIVAERNYGGDMVESTLRQSGFLGKVEVVTASRGKRQRAEPVATLYEQGRAHHVGVHAALEDQMTMWVPDSGNSPDRMDALVWGATSVIGLGQGEAFLQAWKNMAAKDAAQTAAAEPGTFETKAQRIRRMERHFAEQRSAAQPEPATT